MTKKQAKEKAKQARVLIHFNTGTRTMKSAKHPTRQEKKKDKRGDLKMKTEIVKQLNIRIYKDEKELIKKVITLINSLINISFDNCCDGYYIINGISRETGELEDLVEFLKDLAYTEVIELT